MGLAGALTLPAFAASEVSDWARELATIENDVGGDLGVYLLDTGHGSGFGWRVGQRFAMCSSFKLSLAALVFQRIAERRVRGRERIAVLKKDLLPNSPRTELRAGKSMTVLELAEAAVVTSDNTAANLLLHRLGGPVALTAFWRGLGDEVSELDDIEPALNNVPPGDDRNTSSPRAMATTVSKLLSPGVLNAPACDQLLRWMHASETGKNRIRAGLPPDWWAGDKTGTGLPSDIPGTYVDLAYARPPQGAPVVIAAFLRTSAPQPDIDPKAEAAFAKVGALAARWAASRIPVSA